MRVSVWLAAVVSSVTGWEKEPSVSIITVSAVPPSTEMVRVPSLRPVTLVLAEKKEPLRGLEISRAGGVVSTEKLLVYRKASPWPLVPWNRMVWEPSVRSLSSIRMVLRFSTFCSAPPSKVQVPETAWSAVRVTVRALVR